VAGCNLNGLPAIDLDGPWASGLGNTGVILVLSGLSKTKHQGLTLVELIVAVAIAAILVGVAIPSFFNLIADNRLTALTNELVTDMHYARSEAVTRELPVTICASEDGESCSGRNDWSSGWIVFTDASGSNGEYDAEDELLINNQSDTDQISLLSENEYVRFSSRGRSIE
jgi:type IV fimbrial biogenesis protein FimT